MLVPHWSVQPLQLESQPTVAEHVEGITFEPLPGKTNNLGFQPGPIQTGLRKLAKKVSKINLRIIFKPHAHLQSIVKTSVKFQKNLNKTAGGVAHTRYILI